MLIWLPWCLGKLVMLKTINLLVLPGDGVGPEVVSEALKLLDTISNNTLYRFNLLHSDIGGCCIDKIGMPIIPDINKLLNGVDAVLLGAVGGLKWDKVDKEIRPEKGLLQLRESLCAFANYRPAILNASLANASSLKEYLVKDLDILIIRELVSGIYFGEPRGIEINEHLYNTHSNPYKRIIYFTKHINSLYNVYN